MKREIARNTTGHILPIRVLDSSKADGSRLTGLVYNTAGLTCVVQREFEGPTAMTLENYSSYNPNLADSTDHQDPTDVHHIRFCPDGTVAGGYLLSLPDGMFDDATAFGSPNNSAIYRWITIELWGAANMVPVSIEIQIRDQTLEDIFHTVENGIDVPVSAAVAAAEAIADPNSIAAALIAVLVANGILPPSINGGLINVRAGDTYKLDRAGLGNLTGVQQIWFEVKRKATDADADALLTVQLNGGLTRVAGAAPTSSANGTITVTNAAAGDLTVKIDEVETVKLTPRENCVWCIKIRDASGDDTTITGGQATILPAITQATS